MRIFEMALVDQPFGVLELSDRAPEDDAQFVEQLGCTREPVLSLDRRLSEESAKPRRVRGEQRRSVAWTKSLDDPE